MPDPLVVRTMNAFKADLLRQETTQMAAMARRWRQTEAALLDQVELFARRVADDKLTRAQLQDAQYMLDRSQSLLRQARREFDKYVRYAGPLIETRQRQLGEQGIQHAGAAIEAVSSEAGVEIGFNRLPVSAVENMVGLAGDNSPLTTLLESKYGAGVDGMFTELIRATALGKNPRETAQRMVREGFSQSLTQMMVIARTEQLRVYREAARQSYQESGVVERFRRLATRDNRVCAACLMADGEYYELDQFLRAHPQCRCTIVPVVEGFPEVQWQKGPDWFMEQSAKTQQDILGPGRFAAWNDGRFDLDQLITVRSNAQWGDSIQPTPLKVLLSGTAIPAPVSLQPPSPIITRLQPQGTPVSQALKTPKRGAMVEPINRAVAAIDSVHGDGALPELPVKTGAMKSRYGHYKYTVNKDRTPVEIKISTSAPHPSMTTAHEVGHFLEAKGLLPASGNPLAMTKVLAFEQVTRDSAAMKQLDNLFSGREKLKTTSGYEYGADLKYLRYLKRSEEVWARAYAQYIAVRSNDHVMLEELRRVQGSSYPTQWDDADFEPIAAAIDEMFKALGWLR